MTGLCYFCIYLIDSWWLFLRMYVTLRLSKFSVKHYLLKYDDGVVFYMFMVWYSSVCGHKFVIHGQNFTKCSSVVEQTSCKLQQTYKVTICVDGKCVKLKKVAQNIIMHNIRSTFSRIPDRRKTELVTWYRVFDVVTEIEGKITV